MQTKINTAENGYRFQALRLRRLNAFRFRLPRYSENFARSYRPEGALLAVAVA